MPSTFTPNYNFEKIADAEQDDTWGVTERGNQDKLDDVLGGYLAKSVAGSSNVTLTRSEYDHRTIELTGTLTGNIDVIMPGVQRIWHIENATSGAFTITLKVSGQSGFTLVQGKKYVVRGDGTDVEIELSDETVAITGGGTGAVTAAAARTALAVPGLADANTFTADQIIKSTDDGAGVGPRLTLWRDSSSPAPDDSLGLIRWHGENDNDDAINYAQLQGEIITEGVGVEDGELHILTSLAGALAARIKVGAGLYSKDATGGDQGVDTINASEYYRDGVAVGAGLSSIQVITATGTYTAPAGLVRAEIWTIGGGGGASGAAATDDTGSGGGGGGGAYELLEAATIGASQSVTIGAGGTGGAAGNNAGSNGDTTSFGALLSATGGTGGPAPSANSAGGVGGTGSGGDINLTGGRGGPGGNWTGTPEGAAGGIGGPSPFGFGPPTPQNAANSAGLDASDYGAGGSGSAISSSSVAGGDGSDGIIVVKEYF